MTEYVAGFLFTDDGRHVVLIQKRKPQWQAGKLNGVGGKIEDGETPLQAMIREFREETGVVHEQWRQYATLRGTDFAVHFFFAKNWQAYRVETITAEMVDLYAVGCLPHNIIPNIAWLIPMALSFDGGERAPSFEVVETTRQQQEVAQ